MWISVDKKLPEEYKCVLVYNKVFSNIVVGYLIKNEWFLAGDCWTNTKLSGITHWMLLPEAPKMGVATRMKIVVNELPVMASDCPFFYQGDCSLGDRSMCRLYEKEHYPDLDGLEDCSFLKSLKGDGD